MSGASGGNTGALSFQTQGGTTIYCPISGDVALHTHSYTVKGTWKTEPTCTANGTAYFTCSCGGGGSQPKEVPNSALGHQWPSTWEDYNGPHTDTCTSTQHKQVCTRCQGKETGGTKSADHTYAPDGGWVIVTEAKPGVPGVKKRTCTAPGCGHVETGTIILTDDGKGIEIKKDRITSDGLGDSKNPAQVGDTITWDIVIRNLSQTSARHVYLTESMENVTLTLNGKTLEYAAGTKTTAEAVEIPANSSVTVTASHVLTEADYAAARVHPLTRVYNTVSGETTETDPSTKDPFKGDCLDGGTKMGEPRLTVKKIVDDETPKAGEEVKYTITVANEGTAKAKNVIVTDILDSNLTFVSATLNGDPITPDRGVYTVGELAKDGSAELVITAKVKDSVAAGTEITNTATAKDTNRPADPEPKGEVTITVQPDGDTPMPDLEIVKSAPKGVKVGGDVEYTITVTNNGDAPATNVVVTDTLPKELAGYITESSPSYNLNDGVYSWNLGTIEAGGSKKITFTAPGKAGATGIARNTAYVQSDETPDPIHSNEVETKLYKLTPTKDHKDGITVDTTAGTATIKYTITIKNESGFDLYGLDILDTLKKPEITQGAASLKLVPVSLETTDGNVQTLEPEAEFTLSGTEATRHTFHALDRDTVFADGSTVTLKYHVVVTNTGTEQLVLRLSNTAKGACWTTNGAEPQMFRMMARSGGYDAESEEVGDNASVGDNATVIIPPPTNPQDPTVTYPKAEDGKEPDPDPAKDAKDTLKPGTIVIVDPNGGTWTPKTEADKWTKQGGNSERTLAENETVSLRDNPTWDNHVFMGWERTEGERDGVKTVTYTAQWEKDELTDPDKDQNGTKPGDGIPDKYQAVVTYQVENGSWDGTDKAPKEHVFTLYQKDTEGNWTELSGVTLGSTIPDVTHAVPDAAYTADGKGWKTPAPAADTKVTANAVYIYSFPTAAAYQVTYHYTDKDGNEETVPGTPVSDPDTFSADETPEKDGKAYTLDKVVTDDGEKTIDVYYELDEIVDPSKDPDPAKPGDGIPDKYQAVVTYQVENGSWDGTDKAPKEYVFTLYQKDTEGNWTELSNVTLGSTIPDVTHAVPDATHVADGKGWKASAPMAATEVTANAVYVYSFPTEKKDAPKVVVTPDNGEPDGKGEWPDEPDEKKSEPKPLTPGEDGKVTLPDEDDVTPPPGKELIGWTTDPKNPDPEKKPGETVDVPEDEDVTYYPVWRDIVLGIQVKDVSVTYDGAKHPVKPIVVKDGVEVTPDSVTITYKLGGASIEGEPVNAGTYTAEITAKVDGQTLEASATVTIGKRPLNVTTGSASKYYDGTPLTSSSISISGEVSGETVTGRTTGSLTSVGSVSNGYSLTWGTANPDNYRVVETLGTLTVYNRSSGGGGGGGGGTGGGGGGGTRRPTGGTGNTTTTINDGEVPPGWRPPAEQDGPLRLHQGLPGRHCPPQQPTDPGTGGDHLLPAAGRDVPRHLLPGDQ